MLISKYFIICIAGALYSSELHGSDENGDGTEAKPYKTAIQVIIFRNIPLFCFSSRNFKSSFLLLEKALKKSGDIEHFSKILIDAKDQTTGVSFFFPFHLTTITIFVFLIVFE
jgi:hypothetical protein